MASSVGVFTSPDEVQKWYDAVQLYDADELQGSIEKFKEVMPCAKMLFNIGCCYLSIDEIHLALQSYEEAIQMDSHMAVSYFMIGLIYYLNNDFDLSFEYFEKARTALRGNKYIDYSQLGLNYKLYACEVKTNQASILVKQNNIGKAKEFLLLAISCKTEKRHDIISDSLNMLQAGADCAMSLFMLPPHVIFRPSQKIINQLKKKDYLGKAKVVAAENSEDIYACFSGLKAKKDGKIPTHVKEEDVKTMLRDIKISDRKEKLKRTPPQKKLPILNIGKVIDNSSRTSYTNTNPSNSTNGVHNNGYQITKKDESSSNPPRRPPLPITPAPRNCTVETTDYTTHKNGSRGSQAPPPRPPPAKRSPNLNRAVNSELRDRSLSMPSSEINKLVKKPSPLTHNYPYHMQNGYSNGDNNNNNMWQMKPPSKKVHEVEICYTFTHKIRLKEGLTLSQVRNIVEAQAVPDDIHMCTTDEHGRYQPLTEGTLEKLFESNSNKKEIFCSTNPYNKNHNSPT